MHKYTKEDEKLIKQFLESMYEKHQHIRGSGIAGGSGFTDFLHGFLMPFKSDITKTVFDALIPGSGTALSLGAKGLDGVIPGKKYDSFGDVFGGGKRAGRPKKIKVEVSVMMPAVKKGRGRPRKVC